MPKKTPKATPRPTESRNPKPIAARKALPQKRYGTRNLLLQALEGPTGAPGIPTASLVKQVRKLSGTKIPLETIRSSLRALVREKKVGARRLGREKTYKLVQTPAAPVAAVPQAPAAPLSPATPSAADLATALPHKLAVGEVLILHVGEEHVESASNVHGQLVLARHPRPKR